MNLTIPCLVTAVLLIGSAAAADTLTESPDGPEHVKVYLTLEEALGKVFAEADTLWSEVWTPSPEEIAALEASMGWRIQEREFVFHRALRGGRDLGVAMVTEEKGRFKPITFMVKIDPGGAVETVHVMVYRESRGDGVRRQRFLKQFRGRDADDPLRMNRDITNLSGATMSSRAVTAGVKRVLELVRQRYHGGG
ncbi:FMN-binding protein [bacterium]|nr:FMN-binding protein [bacterium]